MVYGGELTQVFTVPKSLTTKLSITIAICLSLLAFAASASAQVGDPTLRTDHPQYAGEGAFQTAVDCVRFAEAAAAKEGKRLGEQERALAIYNWLLTHQWHLASPQENCVPGKTADTTKSQEDLIVFDAAKARFSYGYGLCGTVHAWNEPYWKAAGFNARRRSFPGHTNSEIFYGGAWHAFDTDMAGLLFRRDGVVAGYADIIADPSLAAAVKPPVPHYPFAWPSDFQAMKAGWQEVAKNSDKWFVMYNGGYEAMPGIIHLRRGESFTRWFDPDHYGGPTKRRFWHNAKNGPVRDWTFANNGHPRHDGQDHNARGNAAYCNGEFVWQPVLADSVRGTQVVKNDGKLTMEFRHWSPYVICGDPDDDANPMTSRATGGLIVDGKCDSVVEIGVFTDDHQTQKVPPARLPIDLTEYVKGRNGWHLVLKIDGNAKIDGLKFTTITQVNQAMYPRLKPGGTVVHYRAASRAVIDATPNLFADPTGIPERDAERSANLAFRDRTQSRVAFETTNNKPASIQFPVVSRQPLTEVRAAVRYQARVPPPEKSSYRLEISTDGGQTWRQMAEAKIPQDNEHSSGWLYGSADVRTGNSPGTFSTAAVRATLDAGGHKTGLIDARVYGIHETSRPGEVELTYGWKENGELKTAARKLAAKTTEDTWSIETGDKLRDEFVRISAVD